MRWHRHSRMIIAPCVTCGEPWGGVVASTSCWLGARFCMVPHDAGPVTRRDSTWGAAPYPGSLFKNRSGVPLQTSARSLRLPLRFSAETE